MKYLILMFFMLKTISLNSLTVENDTIKKNLYVTQLRKEQKNVVKVVSDTQESKQFSNLDFLESNIKKQNLKLDSLINQLKQQTKK